MRRRTLRLCKSATLLLVVICFRQPGRAQSDMQLILERLDRLERQNQELVEQVKALRGEIAGTKDGGASPEEPPLSERMDVQERRVEEQAQTKVESGSKLPVRLSGMVLFNAFLNTKYSGLADYPIVAALNPSQSSAGGTLRQSIVGLEFDGGQTLGGGKLSGSLVMDLFAGSGSPLNQLMRIRTAAAQVDWSNTAVLVGQQKPIISPRDPTSLAQVGVSPLTGAGNPWFWQPQARVQHRFDFSDDTSLTARVGILQTNELAATVPTAFASTLERARPALEGRFEFKHGDLEIAPGFHLSTTHVAGTSVPSNALSLDWLYRPWRKIEITGMAFAGANIAHLGTLRQGFSILEPGNAIAIRSRGGWAQLAVHPTSRLSANFMAGLHDDNNADLRLNGIDRNHVYAANLMYRLAPNLILAIEGSQARTMYLLRGLRRNNHYDVAIGYLF